MKSVSYKVIKITISVHRHLYEYSLINTNTNVYCVSIQFSTKSNVPENDF